MSDEEKEAIKEVKHFNELTRYWQEEEYEEKEIAGYIATVLNLIEKQSKEIEGLKEDNKKYIVQLTDEQYRKLVDIIRGEISKEYRNKIKAKIEELNNKLKNADEIEAVFIIKQQQVLQSLLEKE